MTNFPEPKGAADKIIAKAIELIDADVWHSLTNYSITIRDVRIHHENATIVIDTSDVSVLNYGKPSTPYRDAFVEAYTRAMAREKERRMEPLLKSINDENFGKPRKGAWIWPTFFGVPAMVLATWAVVGVVSCSTEAQKVEDARANEVNKYGFKRGAIKSRKVWPDDCANSGIQFNNDPSTGRDFRSDYECRDAWQRWERDGEIWVDWKAE